MASAKSNKKVKKIGAGTVFRKPNGKYLASARRKSIPPSLHFQEFTNQKAAESHLRNLERKFPKGGADTALNFFSLDELSAAKLAIEEFAEKQGDRVPLNRLVALGIESERKEREYSQTPLLSTSADNYFKHRKTAQAKLRGTGKVAPHQQQQERKVIEELCAYQRAWRGQILGDYRVSSLFEPTEEFDKTVSEMIWKRKRHDGQEYSPENRIKTAKTFIKFFDYVKDENRSIRHENPLKNLARAFNKGGWKSPSHLSPDKVRKLFYTAVENEHWIDLVPFMALLFFAGRRPTEIADTNNRKRRFQWKWMRDWKVESKVSGGVLFDIPSGVSKKDSDQEGDLIAAGVNWIEWYYEGTLPTKGEVPFSRRDWDALRERVGLLGREDWSPDVARHTMASAVHRHWSEHREYWLDHLGHRGSVFERHYKSPKCSPQQAEDFLNIRPPEWALGSSS